MANHFDFVAMFFIYFFFFFSLLPSEVPKITNASPLLDDDTGLLADAKLVFTICMSEFKNAIIARVDWIVSKRSHQPSFGCTLQGKATAFLHAPKCVTNHASVSLL